MTDHHSYISSDFEGLPFLFLSIPWQMVLTNMFIGYDTFLESVQLYEPKVNELREKVRMAMKQAVIPMKAYAAEFTEYLELYNLDIETHLK